MPNPKCLLINSDVMEGLRTLFDESVHCCVTSPPYWGLRDYGTPGQLGLEKTPEEYIEKMVAVFREVKRVLRSDGTCWINLGDSYAGGQKTGTGERKPQPNMPAGWMGGSRPQATQFNNLVSGLKPKDLCGIPWRIALALQADGWWLRSDVIWHKPNPMPESCTDRPTTAHEHIFLLTKSAKYFYDAEAVKEKSTGQNGAAANFQRETKDHLIPNQSAKQHRLDRKATEDNGSRNLRSVWTLPTEPFPEAHFATFPTSIPERGIKAGTSEKGVCPKCGAPWMRVVEKKTATPGQQPGYTRDCSLRNDGERAGNWTDANTITLGWHPPCKCPDSDPTPATILDPFSGAATTLMVAAKLGRDAVGIELNPEYVAMSVKRLKRELGMWTEVEVAKP